MGIPEVLIVVLCLVFVGKILFDGFKKPAIENRLIKVSYKPAINKNSIYSGFWKRFAASMIDILCLVVPGYMIGTIIGLLFRYDSLDPTSSIYNTYIMSLIVGICMSWLYYSLFESSKWQATLGKRALEIIVTDTNGNRITWGQATERYFCKIISAIPICLGFIIAGFTKKKQSFHDVMVGTYVINKIYDHNNLEKCVELIKNGDYVSALSILDRIIESGFKNKNVYYYSAVANSKLGNRSAALKDIQMAARFGHEKATRYLENNNIEY